MDSVKEWKQKTEEKFLQEEELRAEKNLQSATNTTEAYKTSFFADNKLPKSGIIRGHESFSKIFESSEKTNCGLLRAYYKVILSENNTNLNSPSLSIKAGFVVTKKKIKKAVFRNRIKRLLRESYRLEKTIIPQNALAGSYEIIFTLSDSGYDNFREDNMNIIPVRKDMNKLLLKIFKQNIFKSI